MSLEAASALAPNEHVPDVPELYTDFVASRGVKLTPAQLALTKVAYDGLEPEDLEGDERELAYEIFGPVEVFPPECRRVLVAVCGGRGGKTYVLGALRLIHLGLTVDLSPLAPGEKAVGIIVAPNRDLSRQALGYIRGVLGEEYPKLKSSEEEIQIRRADGGVIRFLCVAATAGGSALRARSLFAALLDESAFFRDTNYVVNDAELFKAVTPRVLPGGQTLVTSTPWAEMGLLYDEFVENHPNPQVAAPHHQTAGHPHRAIAAHAPTLLMRDNDPNIAVVVAGEEKRDPINAKREFGAQFMSGGASLYFDATAIAKAVDHTLELPGRRTRYSAVGVGSDPGFTSDSAAVAAVERTEAFYRLLELGEMIPSQEPLKPSVVFKEQSEVALRHGAEIIAGDQHYAQSAKEAFDAAGLTFVAVPSGQNGKGEMFTLARGLLHEGRLKLPNHPKLLRQLREVQQKPTPGGGMSITQPRRGKGGHGDLVSALVHAIWVAAREDIPKPDPLENATRQEKAAIEWRERLERESEEDPRSMPDYIAKRFKF